MILIVSSWSWSSRAGCASAQPARAFSLNICAVTLLLFTPLLNSAWAMVTLAQTTAVSISSRQYLYSVGSAMPPRRLQILSCEAPHATQPFTKPRVASVGRCFLFDPRLPLTGTELLERVTASGSLVIRKLGATRAGELAIHRFLSAPSVSCREMLATLAGSTLAASARRHIVVAQDTTEINFAGRGANRRGLARPATRFRRGFSSIPGRH